MSKAEPKTSDRFDLRKIRRWAFRIGRACLRRKRPPSDGRYIWGEDIPNRIRDIKDRDLCIVALHTLVSKSPLDWARTEMRIIQICWEEGRPDLASPLIKDIKEQIDRFPCPRNIPPPSWINARGSPEES